jgi:glutamyl-tRNA synthetase
VKERATFPKDIWEQSSFFFERPSAYDEKASKKAFKDETPEILNHVIAILKNADAFSSTHISDLIKSWITSEEIGFGKVMMPLRLALVGEMKGPDVFDIASILGKEESIKRIKNAVKFLS